jgi:hypothetical protein
LRLKKRLGMVAGRQVEEPAALPHAAGPGLSLWLKGGI